MSEALKEAMKRKRGKGLDISILIGQPHGTEKQVADEDRTLQPMSKHPLDEKPLDGETPPPAHEDLSQDQEEVKDAIGPSGDDQTHDDEDQDLKMLEMLGEDGKQQVTHKPRSLGERAKMMLHARLKGKGHK